MPSVPASPQTPKRRRKSSLDPQNTSASPQSILTGSRRSSVNRRGSQYSIESPATQRLATSHEWPGTNGISSFVEGSESGGLGNLADELAEAFDEDEEPLQEALSESQTAQLGNSVEILSRQKYHRDPSVTMPSPSSLSAPHSPISPPRWETRAKHQRMKSQYDGSQYGNDGGLEPIDGVSPGLDLQLADIETFTQRGSEANGSDMDQVIQLFADCLTGLPSQSRVENGVSRYASHD